MGASQAVGPVFPNKGLLKPSPCAMDRAIRPASPPHRQWSRAGSVRSGYKQDITVSRSASATSTIQNSELAAFPAAFAVHTSASDVVFRGNAICSSIQKSEEASTLPQQTAEVCVSYSSLLSPPVVTRLGFPGACASRQPYVASTYQHGCSPYARAPPAPHGDRRNHRIRLRHILQQQSALHFDRAGDGDWHGISYPGRDHRDDWPSIRPEPDSGDRQQ